MKILLFDIDGTLLFSGGAGIRAINRAFADLFGIADCWGGTVPHGKTDPLIFAEISQRILQRSLRAEELSRLSQRYVELFAEEIDRAPHFRLLPGVSALCKALSLTDGVALGLETGNFKDTAWMKLKRGGLDGFFLDGAFGSDSENRAEIVGLAISRLQQRLGLVHVDPRDIYVIGDAPQDVAAGKEVGVQTIGVATGLASAAELSSCGAHFILSDLRDIAAFFACIGLTREQKGRLR